MKHTHAHTHTQSWNSTDTERVADLPSVCVALVGEVKELLGSLHPYERSVLGLGIKPQVRDPRGPALARHPVDVVGHA